MRREAVQARNRSQNLVVDARLRILRLEKAHIDLGEVDVLGVLVQLRTAGSSRHVAYLGNRQQHIFDRVGDPV